MEKNFSYITQRKIKEEIKMKLDYTKPYYARKDNVKYMITEVNNFPYNGFYRGDPSNPEISVFDRKAGFRPIENCYVPLTYSEQPEKKLYCFQAAANTVYPCYPEFLDKYNDRQKIELSLNRKCIINSP
jgi:hypothetical protein